MWTQQTDIMNMWTQPKTALPNYYYWFKHHLKSQLQKN